MSACWSSATASGTPMVRSTASAGASRMPTRVTTPRPTRATASTPPATCSAPSWSPASSRDTNVGTSTAERAPAARSSNSTFESEFADWKALPRNVVPSTAATTSTRDEPERRATPR